MTCSGSGCSTFLPNTNLQPLQNIVLGEPMIAILSPATTMDLSGPKLPVEPTQPQFLTEAAELVARLRPLPAADLSQLMDLSDDLTALNVARYANWQASHTGGNSRPAISAFRGAVYQGLDADSLTADDLTFAQQHVRILSGLYGVLRPFDRVQPYRLEMKTRLTGPNWDNLYQFWGDKLTQALNDALAAVRGDVLVNLASNEYARAVRKKVLQGRVLDVQFKEEKGGKFRTISFFAKRARGLMTRFMVQERITKPAALQAFAADGYRFNEALSAERQWVFTRQS